MVTHVAIRYLAVVITCASTTHAVHSEVMRRELPLQVEPAVTEMLSGQGSAASVAVGSEMDGLFATTTVAPDSNFGFSSENAAIFAKAAGGSVEATAAKITAGSRRNHVRATTTAVPTTVPITLPSSGPFASPSVDELASVDDSTQGDHGDDMFTPTPDDSNTAQPAPVTPPLGPQSDSGDMIRVVKHGPLDLVSTLGDSIGSGSDLGIATPPIEHKWSGAHVVKDVPIPTVVKPASGALHRTQIPPTMSADERAATAAGQPGLTDPKIEKLEKRIAELEKKVSTAPRETPREEPQALPFATKPQDLVSIGTDTFHNMPMPGVLPPLAPTPQLPMQAAPATPVAATVPAAVPAAEKTSVVVVPVVIQMPQQPQLQQQMQPQMVAMPSFPQGPQPLQMQSQMQPQLQVQPQLQMPPQVQQQMQLQPGVPQVVVPPQPQAPQPLQMQPQVPPQLQMQPQAQQQLQVQPQVQQPQAMQLPVLGQAPGPVQAPVTTQMLSMSAPAGLLDDNDQSQAANQGVASSASFLKEAAK